MLRARLLGGLDVELDGTAIDVPVAQRPWALFAYLALAGHPVARAELAAAFWPDVLDQSARASLRSALWSLRRQLGDALRVEGDAVGLRDLETDVAEFEALAGADPRAALERCRGELLDGLDDEWAIRARDRHRERVVAVLERLAADAEADGRLAEAVELTRRQVEHDRFDEAAHRRLMTRLDAAGDRASAVRAYRALSDRLRRELAVTPSAQTRELAEALRAAAPKPGPAPVQAPVPALPPLVGREAELEILERAWRAAAGQRAGGAVILRGEPGIGKTRLAAELRMRVAAAGAATATGAALDLGGAPPLSLWAELIRELVAALPPPDTDSAWPDDLALLAPEVPLRFGRAAPAGGPAIAPDLQRTRLFEAVVSLLEFAAREAPVLLVLDDVHAADGPSLELVAYAARRLATLPVMLLLTRREIPDSAPADQLEHALRSRGRLVCELPLRRLPDDGAAALARQTARLTDEQVARVVRRAEGNPLFAVETARALAAGQEEVPPSLRIPVRAALAAVESDARRLTEVAAVAARRLDPAELRALDLTSADEAAGAALQTGLLVAEGGGVGFRHALLRDAAYEEIAPPRRPGVHERWARALLAAETAGAPARPAEVARHLRLAAADREAVPHLLRAAREARAVAALAAAIEYVEEALSIAPDRPDLWLELGELEAWRPRREAAERAFARALSLLDAAPPLDRARALLCQARAYHGPICYPRGVLDCASRALELLESSGSDAAAERSEALAAWAWAEAVAGSADRAEELLAELSVPGVAPDDSRVYDVGHARALALMRRGRFADAYAPSVAAGEAIARAGRPDLTYGCWANAASAAHAAGDNRRALEFIERGMAAVRGHGLQALEVHLLGARSHVLRETGRVEEGRAAADAALELAERLGAPELIAMASHDSGLAALATGEHERAARLLADALVDGAPISRPLTRLALAEALARGGRPEAATEQVRAAVLEPVRPSDFPETLVPRLARVQGLIEIASGNREEAVRRLEEARGGWRRLVERLLRSETITVVLADLGRPVVGLIDPEHELARVQADIDSIGAGEENLDALVP